MSAVAEKLNEILADEWACVRVLRRSESQCDEPGKREVIKRIRKDCSVNCVSLANVIRALGGRPTDIPSARFSLKLSDESLSDTLDMFQSAQQHIVDEIAAVLDEPDLKSVRNALVTVQQLHKEDIRWLANAFGAGSSRRCNRQADLGPFLLAFRPYQVYTQRLRRRNEFGYGFRASVVRRETRTEGKERIRITLHRFPP